MAALPKIRLEGLGKTFAVRGGDSFAALDDITLDVEPGEFLVVVGPSGCGKSTLLDIISGLTPPSSGRVLLHDVTVTGPSLDPCLIHS